MMQAGNPFPNFSLPNQDGNTTRLADFAGKWLVVYFYPKDDTPGCTIQGRSFTASKADFDKAGIQVVGVSADDATSHKNFCNKFAFNIDLLADTDSSCAVRYTTTVPTQALGLLNGAFTNEQAGFLAERLRREAPTDLSAQVRRAIRLTTGRVPGESEVKKDVAFIKEIQSKAKLSARDALQRYCLLALNTNEFVYLD